MHLLLFLLRLSTRGLCVSSLFSIALRIFLVYLMEHINVKCINLFYDYGSPIYSFMTFVDKCTCKVVVLFL